MLDALFESVRESRKQFSVYAHADDAADVDGLFAGHNVAVERRPLPPDGPPPFLVVEEDDEFVGAVGLETLEALLEPPRHRPSESVPGISAAYRVLFEALDETVFAAMRRRELVAVSREIEERAYRVGEGTLRVGFQNLSTFRHQVGVYRGLASRSMLDVHVYGASDWEPPTIPGVSYHEYPDRSLEAYWVVAFDEGAPGGQTTALVARETADGYEGFWTDDPEMTREVTAALES
ncbi:histidine kinase [Halorubellus sp. JP-L1]|uniref:DICT sensory domain-containing protein n=1 Tax=Halorubellus sp. JP-L1 TaxID=2715753 RepID=UPI00140AF76B|nr:DICT sensory domain-containing protein [Halorubellus sp. JP-L1]NHN43157.1 histidine kinase [Halorubellus sp. JP-L1]